LDINRFEETHVSRGGCATLWLVWLEDCRRYGLVEISEDGAVLAFHEKPLEKHAGLINAGIYLLERSVVESIPQGRTFSMETDLFPMLIGNGLYAVVGEGPFIDIGTPEAYTIAQQLFAWNTLK
jgi:NDP-sugar pyrophosphorylase family protein